VIAVVLLSFTGCSSQNVAFNVKGKPVSGYVRMTQVQAAYIGSGNAGKGVLPMVPLHQRTIAGTAKLDSFLVL
jgi:hypothetical protein